MPDTDPDPPVILAELIIDITDTIMATGTTADLHPYLAGSKIEFVIDNDNFLTRQLVEFRRSGNRLARFVHEGHWLQRQNLLAGNFAFCNAALKPTPGRRKAMAVDDFIHRHKPDIVSIIPVLLAGIAKAR